MSVATIVSMAFTFINNIMDIVEGTTGTDLFTCILQDCIIVPLVVLAVILLVDGVKVLTGKKEA